MEAAQPSERGSVQTFELAVLQPTDSFFILSHVVLYSLSLTPIPLSFSDAAFIPFERLILSRRLSVLRGPIQQIEGETQIYSSQIKTEANESLTTAMPCMIENGFGAAVQKVVFLSFQHKKRLFHLFYCKRDIK